MSLVAYTITALERDTADADASGKQVIVGATCSMFIQPANTVVQLFDNAAGANGSTAKTTNANGQVTVYVNPGVYRVSVNGSDSFVTVANDADAVFDSVVVNGINVIDELAPKENPNFTGDTTLGGTTKNAATTLDIGFYLNGTALNEVIGYNLYNQDGSANSRSTLFLDGTAREYGFNSTGSFGAADFVIKSIGTTRFRLDASGTILPGASGTQDLGSSSLRFDTLFATNGTINTSDINEKQDIEPLNAAETRVAQNCKTLLRKFRWSDMVSEKGDDARIHFGIIAQDLNQAFTDEGLDAGRYGMFTSDTWIDDESGDEVTRMGVRYTELLAFIISAI
jgi:hypothetical protein